MTITIEIDEELALQIDAVAKDFNKDRLEYISDSLQRSLRRDMKKHRYSDEEVSKLYENAYSKLPATKDEFEIEDSQMEEFWENV